MRDLVRATWPLPWWAVAGPGTMIMIGTWAILAQPEQWMYVAPARVSGLPSEALLAVGPLAAVCTSWVAERFTGRHSLLAAPTVARGGGALGLRALAVLVIGFGGLFAVVAAGAMLYWRSRATGGDFYPVEIVLSTLRMQFFVISGFIIGAVVARWHAAFWALSWSAFWVLMAPGIYTEWLPGRTSNLEYFMFPALAASDHRAISGVAVTSVLVWWIGVLCALVLTLAGSYSLMARRSPWPLGAGVFGLLLLTVAGLVIPGTGRPTFVDGAPQPLTCTAVRDITLCVTTEQSRVLPQLEAPIDAALARIGAHLPDDVRLVASADAVPALLDAGHTAPEILTLSVGSADLGDTAFDMGVALAGLDSCGSGSPGASWAFDFASWFAPESVYAIPTEQNPLSGLDSEQVLAWYSANKEELRACVYKGEGP